MGGTILIVPVFAMQRHLRLFDPCLKLTAALGLAVGLVLTAGAVRAQSQPAGGAIDSLMVARGVAVDATAEMAVAARALALADGQRRAFDLVVRRITLREDHGRLPQPDAEALDDLVEALEIADEKTSAVRYLAKLTVRFKPARIRALLQANRVPYTETRSKPVLLLPVLEQAGALSLFEDGNLWRAAWQALDLSPDALLPVLLPAGDLEDVTLLGAESAAAGEARPLGAISERYRTDTVIVLHAIVARDLAAGGTIKVDVVRHWLGQEFANVVVTGYRGQEGETVVDVLDRVARIELAELEESWKRQTLQTFGDGAVLSVRVPLNSLDDWLAIRGRLERIGMLQQFELRSISRRAAQVVLHISGDPTRLDVSLQQQDLNLVQTNGYWELRRRGSGTDDGAAGAPADDGQGGVRQGTTQ